MMRRWMTAATVVVLGACKGADGAVGPAGPQGPPGPQGPAGPAGSLNRLSLQGQFTTTTTSASLTLPAAAFASGASLLIGCYVSSDRVTWLEVTTAPLAAPSTSGIPFCGLAGVGTATPSVRLVSGPANYHYQISAAW